MVKKQDSWIVLQMETGLIDGFYFLHEAAVGSKKFWNKTYRDKTHVIFQLAHDNSSVHIPHGRELEII